jgi:hypothetical protein
VADSTSLFDYAAGEGPSTYRDVSLPAPEAPLDFSELTPEQQQAGLAACAAIADQSLREQCAFDVVVTGDPGFVSAYSATEEFVAALGGDPCALLPDDVITSIVGAPVTSHEALAEEVSAGCRWEIDSSPDYSEPFVLELNIYHSGGAAELEKYTNFCSGTPIADLADQAVVGCFDDVLALRGDELVAISYEAIIVQDETLIALAEEVLERL